MFIYLLTILTSCLLGCNKKTSMNLCVDITFNNHHLSFSVKTNESVQLQVLHDKRWQKIAEISECLEGESIKSTFKHENEILQSLPHRFALPDESVVSEPFYHQLTSKDVEKLHENDHHLVPLIPIKMKTNETLEIND